MTKEMIKKIITLSLIAFLGFSCSSNKKEDLPTAEKNYLEAHKVLKQKSYSEAGDLFDKIDDDFPFSKWGPKAKTMAVYSRYKNEEYDKLTQIVDDFTRLNPISEHNPYLLYMKGRAYFNKIPHIKRAQDDSQVSSYVFRELIARYPDSAYAKDAKSKLSFIDEHISGHIMEIGRVEIKNKNYIGALKHFTKITNRYRYTRQVSEAYFRIYEVFTKLGINSEADKIEKILINKYPESYWKKYITGEISVQTTKKNKREIEVELEDNRKIIVEVENNHPEEISEIPETQKAEKIKEIKIDLEDDRKLTIQVELAKGEEIKGIKEIEKVKEKIAEVEKIEKPKVKYYKFISKKAESQSKEKHTKVRVYKFPSNTSN